MGVRPGLIGTKTCRPYSLVRVEENVSPLGPWCPEQALHLLDFWVPLDHVEGAGSDPKGGGSTVCPHREAPTAPNRVYASLWHFPELCSRYSLGMNPFAQTEVITGSPSCALVKLTALEKYLTQQFNTESFHIKTLASSLRGEIWTTRPRWARHPAWQPTATEPTSWQKGQWQGSPS